MRESQISKEEVRLDMGAGSGGEAASGKAWSIGTRSDGQDLAGPARQAGEGTVVWRAHKDSELYLPIGFRTSHSPFLEDSSPGCPHGSLLPIIQVSAQMPLCQRGLP